MFLTERKHEMRNQPTFARMQKSMLIIGAVWPEPTSSAAGWRMLQLINLFQNQGYSITFASTAATSEHSLDLASMNIVLQRIELNNESFDAFIQALKPTAVLFDRFMTEEQFGWRVAEFAPDAIRVLDTEDLHCLRHARHKALKENREVEPSDFFSNEAKREIASIFRCDMSIMISEVEIELLNAQFSVSKALLHYLPFTVEEILTSTPKFENRAHFITIGNFLHAPNWDAVQYLKTEIWPLIRKALPKAEMHVYGAYASQKVEQVHQPKDGFFIKGRAENAEQVMLESRVCLAPLRFGAGLKGKLLDAMKASTPSVTTSIGAEGMQTEKAWPGAVADQVQDFAKAAITLYTDADAWTNASERCVGHLMEKFEAAKYYSLFQERFNQLEVGLEAHRQANFIGAMLQHHTMKSTAYMAKWIEAKNKT